MKRIPKIMLEPEALRLRNQFIRLLETQGDYDEFIRHMDGMDRPYQMRHVETALDAIPRNLRPMKNRRILIPALVHLIMETVRHEGRWDAEHTDVFRSYAKTIIAKQLVRSFDGLEKMQEVEKQADQARDRLVGLRWYERIRKKGRQVRLRLQNAFASKERKNRSGKMMQLSIERFNNIIDYFHTLKQIQRERQQINALKPRGQ